MPTIILTLDIIIITYLNWLTHNITNWVNYTLYYHPTKTKHVSQLLISYSLQITINLILIISILKTINIIFILKAKTKR